MSDVTSKNRALYIIPIFVRVLYYFKWLNVEIQNNIDSKGVRIFERK